MGDLHDSVIELYQAYGECAGRHNASPDVAPNMPKAIK